MLKLVLNFKLKDSACSYFNSMSVNHLLSSIYFQAAFKVYFIKLLIRIMKLMSWTAFTLKKEREANRDTERVSGADRPIVDSRMEKFTMEQMR